MSNSNESIQKTLVVTVLLCVVCAVIVAGAAVSLKPMQKANKQLDFNRNILAAAGLLDPDSPVNEQFERVETRIVDLRTGTFSSELDPASYDQRSAAKDTKMSSPIPADENIAGLGRKEHFAEVYLVKEGNRISKIILPIRGYGLWSTLYGFIALEADMNTVVGIGYYDHLETPGLGGEVDNPEWKAKWAGKEIYGTDGNVALSVIKGQVPPSDPNQKYKVDGLSGATLTTNGVDNMIKYWLGESGYANFLSKLKAGEA